MRAWLAPLADVLARGEAAMLVHVAAVEGSAPREAGAQMLVSEDDAFGTIGGGRLEHEALARARALLASGGAAWCTQALGPELSQCCGGSVTLAFEPFAPADRAWVEKLRAAAAGPTPVTRTVELSRSGALRRSWAEGGEAGTFRAARDGETLTLRETMNLPLQELWLFGAGHVGRAVAPALAPLGFRLTWVDGRANPFPAALPGGVRTLALAMPELVVDEAAADSVFLVMTHSHPLDEAICEAVLRRGDFAYLGLIGSASKRARFRRRLRDAGIDAPTIARMVCPIGLAGITDKAPACIAASVAADLLVRRERRLLTSKGADLHAT